MSAMPGIAALLHHSLPQYQSCAPPTTLQMKPRGQLDLLETQTTSP